MKKTTDELIKILKSKNSVEEYFHENSEEIIFDTLPELLETHLKNKGISKSEAIENSQIEKHYGYQIFSGLKRPSRDKLIMLCFGLELKLGQFQQALKKAGWGELYPRDRRDSVIIFAIYHQLNVMETNDMLYDMKLKILE